MKVNEMQPLVSIGLPVYNGENYICEAIDSILNQTFANFEIIISDNASSDRTEAICQEYAARDSRISYYRQEKNLGAAPNYNFVFQLAQGKYFKWLAHDDVCAPEFLEKSVAILESDHSVVLCYSRIRIIDKEGKVMSCSDPLYEWISTGIGKLSDDSDPLSIRFRNVIGPHPCYPVFGLIRTVILKETGIIGSYSDSDRVLLAQLALRGKFYQFPEDLLYLRRHLKQSIQALASHRSQHKYTHWFDPVTKDKIIFPHWRVLKELLISIKELPLSWQEKLNCYLALIPWLRRSRKGMIEDLYIASQQILAKLYRQFRFGLKKQTVIKE